MLVVRFKIFKRFDKIYCSFKSFKGHWRISYLVNSHGEPLWGTHFFFFWILFYFFIQHILISHQFYTHQCMHVKPNRPIHHNPQHPPPHSFPPLVSIHLFCTSVSQFLPCKPVHLYHVSRFHIYVLIYDICFSLSDLLHSVWLSLDPSTSQQMTQFRSFLWLSNIPLYICTTSSLSIHLSIDI